MTREEMAQHCDVVASFTESEFTRVQFQVIAAELRKTCAGCKHHTDGECRVRETYWDAVPSDGYCHRYEVK